MQIQNIICRLCCISLLVYYTDYIDFYKFQICKWIDITQTHLEQVKSFKYLGTTVNGNNSIEEEIKGRIFVGNKAFYANQDLFKSKLLTKNSKLRMYKTLVRPVVTNACETWVLKENLKTKLRVFERKVLRRIYRPTKQKDGTWRIKSTEELNRLTGNKNILNYIKAQSISLVRTRTSYVR
jgi:hypothetical protein